MHICIAFDCLFPWTHGGGERWYRALADEYVRHGHRVTYLTRQQWPDDSPPEIPGVEVVVVSPASELYGEGGARRIGPALEFARGVFLHLLRHRRFYDVVEVSQTPPLTVPAARLALLGARQRMGVDWMEVWSNAYWRRYLGPVGGTLGIVLQRASAVLSPLAIAHGRLTYERLPAAGARRERLLLPGLIYRTEQPPPTLDPPPDPHVLFVGRHIPEKGVTAVPDAVARARRELPGLRATVLGSGPVTAQVRSRVDELGLEDVIDLPGFVPEDELEDRLRGATALLFPSEREGFGLVVVEASAVGTPTIVVAGPDNAAVDLVEHDVNGFVAPSRDADDLAAA
ncbi:glycosyltransferase family 4 protein, partial [Motilibacter deserti]|nr:glycosyltransferase family 4 protein [Motilibacter deserti]